ncbi:MAG: hypothetical protein ACHQ9S_08485 [Candidatus Binatia bacterium]
MVDQLDHLRWVPICSLPKSHAPEPTPFRWPVKWYRRPLAYLAALLFSRDGLLLTEEIPHGRDQDVVAAEIFRPRLRRYRACDAFLIVLDDRSG